MENIKDFIDKNKTTRTLITPHNILGLFIKYIKSHNYSELKPLEEDLIEMSNGTEYKDYYNGKKLNFYVRSNNIIGCRIYDKMIELDPISEDIYNDILYGNENNNKDFVINIKNFFHDIMLCYVDHQLNPDYYEQKAEVAEIKRKLGEM